MNRDQFPNPPGEIVDIDAEGDIAYVPSQLPNLEELDRDTDLFINATRAERNLGNLSGIGRELENPKLLLAPYLFRESLSSSIIEGTQTNLEEVLKADVMQETSSRDVKEVMNYRDAVIWALERLEKEPLSLDLIKRLHGRLFKGLEDVQGPVGQFRDTQVYVGPRYTPPPPSEVEGLMQDLIDYLTTDDEKIPDLIKLALFHYQFEAIHPFGDGNGRVGRILIILFLDEKGILEEPLLYI
jgi:Fic family protein